MEALSQSSSVASEEKHVNVLSAGAPVEIRYGHFLSTSVVWLMGIN